MTLNVVYTEIFQQVNAPLPQEQQPAAPPPTAADLGDLNVFQVPSYLVSTVL